MTGPSFDVKMRHPNNLLRGYTDNRGLPGSTPFMGYIFMGPVKGLI